MCQLSNQEILIVGGFNSNRFLSDHFILKFNSSKNFTSCQQFQNKRNKQLTLFPFQVPSMGDVANRQAIVIDWQQMSIN